MRGSCEISLCTARHGRREVRVSHRPVRERKPLAAPLATHTLRHVRPPPHSARCLPRRSAVWQWVRHHARTRDGRVVTAAWVNDLLAQELDQLKSKVRGEGAEGLGDPDLFCSRFLCSQASPCKAHTLLDMIGRACATLVPF